jgi:hypothetical protein
MKCFPLAAMGLVFLGLETAFQPAVAGTNSPEIRLTVELHDGSRVVGSPVDKNLKFRSALLGEFQLAFADILAVECVSSNSAKVATSQGDALTVTLAGSALALKTGFGKVAVAPDLVRRITVSTAGVGHARRPGLVALWSGEDNGDDFIGNHHAELTDISFADGKVGRAFSLEGDNSVIKIPGSESLNVSAGRGFTLSAWIKPSNVSKNNPIFEWVQAGHRGGTQFYIYPPHGGPGTLYAMFSDTEGGAHYFSAAAVVVPNEFQHVALTFDKETGVGKIYGNGTEVAQQHLGDFMPQTACDLYLGKHPMVGESPETYQFNGLIDEAAVYDRALSASEIRDLCTADNRGEPLPAPAARPFLRYR